MVCRWSAAALVAASLLLAGCATAKSENSYGGRTVAEAVERLGPPQSVADQAGGRRFTWSASDAFLEDGRAPNPANWLSPDTKVGPTSKPRACTLTLVAHWGCAARLDRQQSGPQGCAGGRPLRHEVIRIGLAAA